MITNLFFVIILIVSTKGSPCKSDTKICVFKCCDKGQMIIDKYCKNVADEYSNKYNDIPVYKWRNETNDVELTMKKFDQVFELAENLDLEIQYVDLLEGGLYMLEDGSLQSGDKEQWYRDEKSTFCIDFKLSDTNDLILISEIPKNLDVTKVAQAAFVKYGSLTSCFFMALILIVYGLLPELRNLPGLHLITYLVCMIIFLSIKAAHYLWKSNCSVTCPIRYYFQSASFLWLNVMAVQAWKHFTRGSVHLKRSEKRRKFLKHNVFVWTVCLFLLSLAMVVDYTFPDDYNNIKPNFQNCMNGGFWKTFLWSTGPACFLSFINFILFILTVKHTYNINRNMVKQDGGSNRNRISVGAYFKVSVLMGVTWLAELVPNSSMNTLWAFILVNMFNVLSGIPLFCVFVLNKRVLQLFCKRFNIKDPCSKRKAEYTSTRTTRTGSSKSAADTKPSPLENPYV